MTDPSVPIVPGGQPPTLAQLMPPPVVKPPRSRPTALLVTLALVAVAAVSAGTVFMVARAGAPPETLWTITEPSPTPPPHSPLYYAKEECDGAGELFDNEKTLVLDMKGDDIGSGDGTILDLGCILGELRAPAFVVQEMNSTRALDGRQQQTWEQLQASWTYHPDDGLDIIFRYLG